MAAYLSTTLFDVRPTNGNDANGGGWDSASTGTNYPASNTSFAYTDAALVTTTTASSVNRAFVAADVGNVINITAGTNWTVGRYRIVSVAAGVATLDAVAGTAGATGGTGTLGGSLATLNKVFGTGGLGVAASKAYVKAETWSEKVDLQVAPGSAANTCVVEGYNTTQGDYPLGSNRPRNTFSGAGVGFNIGQSYYLIKHIWKSGSASYQFQGTSYTMCLNCRASGGSSYGFVSVYTVIACEGDTNTAAGIYGATYVNYCAAHGNTTFGFTNINGSITWSLGYANTSTGFDISSASIVNMESCTSYGNTGASSDGFAFGTPYAGTMFMNCISANNGRDGVRATAQGGLWSDYNDFNGNSGVARTNVAAGPNDSTLSPSFTNAAGGDFSIGTNLKALGFPGLFPGATSTGYLDMGAVQRQEAAGGSGGISLTRVQAGM